MNLLVVGCNFRTADIAVRERLTLPADRQPAVLAECLARFGGEAVILSTCNRLEFYLADSTADRAAVNALLNDKTGVASTAIEPTLVELRDHQAVKHLFRVAASLNSLVIGEGQIAGQVKDAYELASRQVAAGPLLHALFQHARVVARRVKRETGIGAGQVSISSLAVEYVRQVFDHFDDKSILVIGAGKMGLLTLRSLKNLEPRQILVTNRSPDKAAELARHCGGVALPWDQLDVALAQADIVLSTTGAPEPIVTLERFQHIAAKRTTGPIVILDIAVPRDFDPAIHDGETACLFNIDDLTRIRESKLADRKRHIPAAEAIVEHESRRFVGEWARRKTGPVIARLTADLDAKRQLVLSQLLSRLNGRLTEDDKKQIEGAFRLLQNQFLHGPVSTVGDEAREGGGTLLNALRQLFGLK